MSINIDKKSKYPRPQLYRDGYISLNGQWEFLFDAKNKGEGEGYHKGLPVADKLKIKVPFSYETAASGINKQEPCNNVWYSRKLDIGKEAAGKRTILHFEGSDYVTKVWINGQGIGRNKGGYHRFSFDISDSLRIGDNTLVVKCEDSLDARQVRGKQRWYEGGPWGCFYTQTTGIWKEVWLEHIDKAHIINVKTTPLIDSHEVRLEFEVTDSAVGLDLDTEVFFENKAVAKVISGILKSSFSVTLSLNSSADNWQVAEWNYVTPKLYDVKFTLIKSAKAVDTVESYFGFREFRVEGNTILLNRVPIYQRLILDQGYHPEGCLTANSPDDFKRDLELIKSFGYNGVRMHQKIEDERYLYWADRLGMIVWCEMPSPYEFDDTMMEDYTEQWIKVVRQNYNHPSICVWVPFNESWGVQRILTDRHQQAFTDSIYYLTKAYDKMRPVISNDGWEHTTSDIITLHNYVECGDEMSKQYSDLERRTLSNLNPTHGQKLAFAEGYGYNGQPIIVSEYGGISFKVKRKEDWGYGKQVGSEEEFLNRFSKVTYAIKNMPNVCGFCYTQFTDVHQETNGLADSNREPKILPEKIRKINE